MAVNKGWDPARFLPILVPGEGVCRTCPDVELEVSGNSIMATRSGNHNGSATLTTQRFVFGVKNSRGPVQSISMPFYCLQGIEIKQPIFGANYIQGYVCSEAGGGWDGRAQFKMYFKSGGAIEFAMDFLRLIRAVPPNPPPYQYAGTVGIAVPVAQPRHAAYTVPVPSAPPAEYGDEAKVPTVPAQAAYYQESDPHTMFFPTPSAPPASVTGASGGDDGLPSYYDATKKDQ